MKYTIPILLLCLVIFSSCASKKEVLFFQDIEKLTATSQQPNEETVIRVDDLLYIVITGNTPEVGALFNPITNLPPAGVAAANNRLQTYIVEQDGSINFPLIGTVNVAGATRQEVVQKLQQEASVYVKNPVVNVRIINFTISVLGEVARPGTFTITDERISVLEALGLAGDLTIFGERKTVKVIRETNGIKTYGELDFTSIDVVNSPFYYLQQNDVVLVAPNRAQIQSAAFNRNSTIFISIAGIIISVLTILTR